MCFQIFSDPVQRINKTVSISNEITPSNGSVWQSNNNHDQNLRQLQQEREIMKLRQLELQSQVYNIIILSHVYAYTVNKNKLTAILID